VKYFEKLEARYPFGPYAQQSQINVAYCHWKDGELAQAITAVDRFLQLHPGHPSVDYAYYLKGLITFNDNMGFMGRLTGQDLSERDPRAARDAFEAFKILTTRFPESKYAPDALDRMRYIVNSLADSDVNTARYYFRRGAFLAAINRAQRAITDYDRAPATEEALYILYKSYEALNMKDLSNDALRVLKLNFPQSQILVTGKRTGADDVQASWWQIWRK
jgi:outer membrane protein assembly factor BamD